MKFLAALATALIALSSPAFAAATAKPALKAQRVVLPTNVRPDRYDIHVKPNADQLTFSGHTNITLTVVRATDRIVLNVADLSLSAVSLSGQAAPPKTVLDDKQQTAAFVFSGPLAPGKYTLSIDYSGKIFEQASGLFALDYDAADGTKRRALFVQGTDAGRVYAYRTRDLDTDVRHETTHALLHTALPFVFSAIVLLTIRQ